MYHSKIFILFQRLHNRDEFEGTGIGLSVVKKHIESWMGKMWLESELNKGTQFYFTVPKTTQV
jgi:light-regulated signal transduction histidine kinase (bacteriophytochrome)